MVVVDSTLLGAFNVENKEEEVMARKYGWKDLTLINPKKADSTIKQLMIKNPTKRYKIRKRERATGKGFFGFWLIEWREK